MLDSTQLRGIIPPICTPMTEAGEIDIPSVHTLIDYLIESGVHGVFAFGSTGEGPSLTVQQRDLMLKSTIAAVQGRVPVLVGVTDVAHFRPSSFVFRPSSLFDYGD